MDLITSAQARQLLPLLRFALMLALVLCLAVILVLGRQVLVPLALAILLTFALAPVANFLQRHRFGHSAAVLSSILAGLLITSAIVYAVISQLADLASLLPGYRETILRKINALVKYFGEPGTLTKAREVIGDVMRTVQSVGAGAAPVEAPVAVRISGADEGGLDWVLGSFTTLAGPLVTAAAVFLLSAFMLAQRADLRNRFLRLSGTEDLQRTTAALDDAGQRVGRMLLTQLALNSAYAAVIAGGLWLIGLPSPFLWGVIAGIARFIPYVGVLLGVLPPLIVAFAADPTWSSLVYTALLFALVEPIVAHLLEPILYGRRSGLSPTAVLVSTIIWSFLWGPIGLVLATPMTICLIVIGRHIERLEFLDILLGDRPPLAPQALFYQHLLANNTHGARDQALEALRDQQPLAQFYDEVAFEALRSANLDVVRGSIDGDRLQRLMATFNGAIQSIGARAQVRSARRAARTGVPGALIVYGDHAMDQPAARMLAQVLGEPGPAVPSMPGADARTTLDFTPRLVVLSYVEAQSLLHIRAACIAVRRHAPGVGIIVCIWQKAEPELLEGLRARLQIAGLVTTVAAARELALQSGRSASADRNSTQADSTADPEAVSGTAIASSAPTH